MPNSGSQVVLCDLPVRFDTYVGCSHGCRYCFVSRKFNIANIRKGESAASLRHFIAGKRTETTKWCDFDIPLHWGGMSDPFQPIERTAHQSLEALKVFAETGYPFVVSTKSDLIAEEPYFSLLKQCNCVVQFSACGTSFNDIEPGATPYAGRLEAAAKIAPYKRVNIRLQPYIPAMFAATLKELPHLADIGVHGIIVEGMKFTKKRVGTEKLCNDFVFPTRVLIPQFRALREKAHSLGMKFYCAENRLRDMGDELCCCGIEGMGWKVNTLNLNHILFDRDSVTVTPAMKERGGYKAFASIHQTTLFAKNSAEKSFEDCMWDEARMPQPFLDGGGYSTKNLNTKALKPMFEALKVAV